MKPIGVRNPDADIKMKLTGAGMKDILHFDPDAEVKTVDNEVRMKLTGRNLAEQFYFYPGVERDS